MCIRDSQATWGTGLHFKIPIFDRVARRVDLKEQVVDFAPQPDVYKRQGVKHPFFML